MVEVWKNIDGFNNYKISNFGRVKSLKRFGVIKDRIVKGTINYWGYKQVYISDLINIKLMKVHRLVALHFLDKVPGKDLINHKDGDKSNNHVDNLEWCTPSENSQHSYDNGLQKRLIGDESPHSKSVIQLTKDLDFVNRFPSMTEAAKQCNISGPDISRCCRGVYDYVGGYKWILEKDYNKIK